MGYLETLYVSSSVHINRYQSLQSQTHPYHFLGVILLGCRVGLLVSVILGVVTRCCLDPQSIVVIPVTKELEIVQNL